jgi:hypothetical protein
MAKLSVIRCKHIYNFLCSMLVFTTIVLCFVYTSWRFYAFSGTNLLTRCHSASSSFLLFLCFKKFTQEIFSEYKAQSSYFSPTRYGVQSRDRGESGASHTIGWRGSTPWPRHQVVWAPGPPTDIALPPIYSFRGKNPK